MASELVGRMKLGSQGVEISSQGLGCMGMSVNYGSPKPEQDMINLIHHAIDSGVTFLDTSDVYGPHTNEILIGKVLNGGWREKVQIATKFGILRMSEGQMEVNGGPSYVHSCCEASLKRLDIDYIDPCYAHRIDARIPIEITVCAPICFATYEASSSTIRRAHEIHPIAAVQMEWSVWSRDIEEDIVHTCRELGIGIVTYSPIGRGFLAEGPKLIENLSKEDYRTKFPRFNLENLEHNKFVFEGISEIASRKGCTPAQVALAWLHHQGKDACPIPGRQALPANNLEELGNTSAFFVENDLELGIACLITLL